MKKILLFILAASFTICQAQPNVGFTPILSSGLTKPVDIVNAKDGTNRLFFVQQNGLIRIYSGGTLLTTPFLDISSIITYENGGERGLLSLVFHPQYATNGYFFVYYNNSAGNVSLAQYHRSAGNINIADPASGKVLMTTTKPFTNHNGCQLLFGPDGYLYFGTGDGGSGGDPNNNAQNGASRLGKMIRIDVNNFTDATEPYYDIPATNPFINTAGYLPEIYATGLRNPWRWSFDRQTNDIWLADVGQDAWEEVNTVSLAQSSGLNYGWRCYEGTHTYNTSQCGPTPATGKTAPIFEYPHSSTGGYSITGGYVYRGTEYPGLQGYYICCDYVTTNGWLIKPNGTGTYSVTQQTNFPANIVSFGEAEDGTLYAASLGGTIYKVIQNGVLPIKLISFSGQWQTGYDRLVWVANVDASLQKTEVEQSTDGTRFSVVGSQSPITSGSTASYQQNITNTTGETHYYRLKMTFTNSAINYSGIVKIDTRNNQQVRISYNSNNLQVTTPYSLKQISILTMAGQLTQTFTNIQAGSHQLLLTNMTPGIYLVQCFATNGRSEQLKIAIP